MTTTEFQKLASSLRAVDAVVFCAFDGDPKLLLHLRGGTSSTEDREGTVAVLRQMVRRAIESKQDRIFEVKKARIPAGAKIPMVLVHLVRHEEGIIQAAAVVVYCANHSDAQYRMKEFCRNVGNAAFSVG